MRNTVVIVCNRFLYSEPGAGLTVRVPNESVPGFIIQTLNVDDEYFQGVKDQYAQHWSMNSIICSVWAMCIRAVRVQKAAIPRIRII